MDKELTKILKRRLRIAAVFAVCLIAIVALPAVASAAPTLSATYPGDGSVHARPSLVGAELFATPDSLASAVLTVDGTEVRTRIKLNSVAGRWTSSEETVNGVERTTWAWEPVAGDGTLATVYGFVPVLADGAHSATVDATDTGGAPFTTTWSFEVTTPVVTGPGGGSGINAANLTCRSSNCHGTDYDAQNAMGPACTACHKNKFGPHGWNMTASGHSTTLFGKRGSYEVFDGSGSNPLIHFESELASASLPATWLVEAGFGWATRPAGLGSSVAIGDEGTMTTNWAFPTAQVFWDPADVNAPTDAMKGMTKDTVVTCEDCHTGLSAAGPHGAAAANKGLDTDYPGDYSMAILTKQVTSNNTFISWNYSSPAQSGTYMLYVGTWGSGSWVPSTDPLAPTSQYYTPLSVSGIAMMPTMTASVAESMALRANGTTGASAVICAKCHDLMNVVANGNGATNAVGSNTAHNSGMQDKAYAPQCVNCHIGIPHGWKRPRLLVNTDVDVAPYRDPLQSGYTASGGGVTMYRWNPATSAWDLAPSGTGRVNRLGMQSLSAVDNHVAVKDHPDPYISTVNGAGLTTVNTDDMVYWSEAGCKGCNDHTGEDEIRVLE